LIRNSTSGTLYIADTGNDRNAISIGASSGTLLPEEWKRNSFKSLNLPYGFAIDSTSNSFIIVNYGAHNVFRWVLVLVVWTLLAGSASGTSGSTSTLLANPLSVVLDPYSNMYVTDTANHRVQFFLAGSSMEQQLPVQLESQISC
jgi:DNA-binding beta-propeller fold protein YncE